MPSIKNADIAGMISRLNLFRKELLKGQSEGVASFREHDINRLKSYMAAIESFKEWVIDEPKLDLPKVHPSQFEVLFPEPVLVENQDVNTVVRLVDSLIVELGSSQSADLASNLEVYDSERFDAIVGKVNSFIENYIEEATPLDMPETASAPDSK